MEEAESRQELLTDCIKYLSDTMNVSGLKKGEELLSKVIHAISI